jgi:hypothetical protein
MVLPCVCVPVPMHVLRTSLCLCVQGTSLYENREQTSLLLLSHEAQKHSHVQDQLLTLWQKYSTSSAL